MPRSSSLSFSKPLYRDIVKQAFDSAWGDRRYWVLALFAGILMSAGSYDILWRAFQRLTSGPSWLFVLPGLSFLQRLGSTFSFDLEHILAVVGGMEALLFIALLALSIAAVSCISQGGLVYALHARKRNGPSAIEAFRFGSFGLWPIIVLNIFSLGVVWLLQIALHMPAVLSSSAATTLGYGLYVLASVLFILIAVTVSIIHIFALNAMMLQGATLREALKRGCILLQKHWLIVLETCVLQAFISIAIWFMFVILFLMAMIPVFVLIVAAAMANSATLFSLSLLSGIVIFLVAALCVGGFTIQFQYATWTTLYRRLGEGGALPKIHRLVRSLFGVHVVPES